MIRRAWMLGGIQLHRVITTLTLKAWYAAPRPALAAALMLGTTARKDLALRRQWQMKPEERWLRGSSRIHRFGPFLSAWSAFQYRSDRGECYGPVSCSFTAKHVMERDVGVDSRVPVLYS